MKHFMIKYQFANGTPEEWHREVGRFIAALNSKHTEALAIDMTIGWEQSLSINRKNGSKTTITSQPRNGGNAELIAVGAEYGVIKLPTDPPHWSDDGR